MIKLGLLISALILSASNAAEPSKSSESLEARTARRARETPLLPANKPPNEIKAGKLTYSGIAVEMVQVDNALQLLNPAAPAHYGEAEANVVREPAGGRVSGLKILSIQF